MNKNPSMNLIIGGPQPNNTTGMTASEAQLTKESDQKIRKQWNNMRHLKCLKQKTVGSPPCTSLGMIDETLRTMVDIKANCPSVGHMFLNKDIFWIELQRRRSCGVSLSDQSGQTIQTSPSTAPAFMWQGIFVKGLAGNVW